MLAKVVLFRSRIVACIVGQIISMQPVLGPLVRLKTRDLCNCILLRASWNSLVALTAPTVEELRHWLQSVNDLNIKGADLQESDLCDLETYTDASEIASVCDSSDLQTDFSLAIVCILLRVVGQNQRNVVVQLGVKFKP